MKLHSSTNQAYQTVTGYDARGVEIDGAKMSTISLEVQLRTLAAKLERRSRINPAHKLAGT